MSKRDWFLFVSTFCVAILCGMWLYFTTFVPVYIANPVVGEIVDRTAPRWTASVQLYGGCNRSGQCSAFAITSRGSYQYQPTPTATVERGSLPNDLLAAYDARMTADNLDRLAQPVRDVGCRSAVDGVDYELRVVLDKQAYALDTCRTSWLVTGELGALVATTLRFMDNPEQYQPPIQSPSGRSGIGGYLEGVLQDIFDYDEQ